MSDRLGEVVARVGAVRQLSTVIGAMRGIAASHAREAQARLPGIHAYAGTVGEAIGRVLACLPAPPETGSRDRRGGRTHLVVALCAEQGFAGAFSERILDLAVRRSAGAQEPASTLMIVGERGLTVAAARGLAPAWGTAMITHAGQMEAVAGTIVEAIFARVDDSVAGATVLHASPGSAGGVTLAERRLLPFDFGRFPPLRGDGVPLLTLPPPALLSRLVEEYAFAEICEALILSFAAENEARMRAMIAARDHVDETLAALVGCSRQLRQEIVTEEILELIAGSRTAGASGLRRPFDLAQGGNGTRG